MKIVLPILGVFLVGGVFYFWFEEEPEPEVLEDTDTGFTRHETEELMRTIGYVQ